MASPSDIRAGRAFVEIGTEDDELDSGLARAATKLKAFGAGIDSIGGGLRSAGRFIDDAGAKIRAMGEGVALAGIAIKGGLGYAMNTFATMGSEIETASERTGVAVESLSLLNYAARRTGTDLEAMEKAVRKMQEAVVDAAQGGTAGTKALKAFGLSIKDLNGLRPEEMLGKVADRLDAMPDPTARAAAAMGLFGRAGTKMLPMLQQGSTYLAQLESRYAALGLTISSTDAEAADKLNDTMGDLWDTVKMGVFNIGAALAPEMQDLADEMIRIVAGSVRWVKANKDVFVTLGHMATGVVGVGAALLALGTGVSGVGGAVELFGTIVENSGKIAVVAAAGVGGYFAATSQAGQQAANTLVKVASFISDTFVTLRDDVLSAFGAIRTALNAGDFQAAARVLWASVVLEFDRGLLDVYKAWDYVKRAMLAGWEDLKAVGRSFWVDVKTASLNAWDAMLGGGMKAWSILKEASADAMAFWKRAFAGLGDYIAKMFDNVFLAVFDSLADLLDLIPRRIAPEFSAAAEGVRLYVRKKRAQSDENFAFNESAADATFKGSVAGNAAVGNAERARIDANTDSAKRINDAAASLAKAQIAADAARAKAGIKAANDPYIQKLADAVQAAGEEVDAAVAAAGELAPIDVPGLPQKRKNAQYGLDEAAAQLKTIALGQFGGLGAGQSLSTGNGIDRIVREQQKTNDHLAGLRVDVKQGGITYGP
jgi:hypothetical protein